MDFEDLVRHENAHPGLAFRARAYAKGEHDQLTQDLIGLANASFTGTRLLVIGVDVETDKRRIRGITQDELASLQNLLPRIAARLIEPALGVRAKEDVRQGRQVSVGDHEKPGRNAARTDTGSDVELADHGAE